MTKKKKTRRNRWSFSHDEKEERSGERRRAKARAVEMFAVRNIIHLFLVVSCCRDRKLRRDSQHLLRSLSIFSLSFREKKFLNKAKTAKESQEKKRTRERRKDGGREEEQQQQQQQQQ